MNLRFHLQPIYLQCNWVGCKYQIQSEIKDQYGKVWGKFCTRHAIMKKMELEKLYASTG